MFSLSYLSSSVLVPIFLCCCLPLVHGSLLSSNSQTTLVNTFKLPKQETWLESSIILDILEPNPDDNTLSCYYDMCGSPGQFIDTLMTRCNSSISTSLTTSSSNSFISVKQIKTLMEDCLCGKNAGEFQALNVLWLSCVSCIASTTNSSNIDAHPNSSMLNAYTNACSCSEPGRLEALSRLGDPHFQCTKQDKLKTRTYKRMPTTLGGQNSSKPSNTITTTEAIVTATTISATAVTSRPLSSVLGRFGL